MKEPGSTGRPAADPANGRRAASFGPSFAYLLAVVVVIGGVAYWLTAPSDADTAASPRPVLPVQVATSPEARDEAEPAASGPTAASAPVLPARVAAHVPNPDDDQTPDLTAYLNPGEKPTMGEVIERLHRAGVTTGVAAFNPPGTKPPMIGLAVPEDFALPPGYVRHHQTTDDGQDIEPILMYAPDHPRFVGGARTRDRIVPPEQAPPGLPLRKIVIPAPAEPDKAGS
ncbi:hypothetical protein [Piscinibacter gummiphilus]|uniref:Uncharacterized protein n=1 Tax=Piscinibacter gummiphilus TaxID=946333 RepID=A0ABZ0CNZ3_9BURK|nr:hypothetical protein [Piscinibacter gummiphilus]WOB06694.1 hypothetical protein RXV79_17395 [Piscinibacter gummiphilus]